VLSAPFLSPCPKVNIGFFENLDILFSSSSESSELIFSGGLFFRMV